MKQLFDKVSNECSVITTKSYSTSFSLGIRFLNKSIRQPIYSIYGFVRFADEIVDTFHDYNKLDLFKRFEADTYKAIDEKISLNPILNSFQYVVNQYNIDIENVRLFLKSMEMDLAKSTYSSKDEYQEYIVGSAEVVGLMCLSVFVNGDKELYERLKPYARSLGSAFQKVNFLRDFKYDHEQLGRTYFPNIDFSNFDQYQCELIKQDIEKDFAHAKIGIDMLPRTSKLGVYVAYIYYTSLFKKIVALNTRVIKSERIRISNKRKAYLFFSSYFKYQLNLL